VFQRRDHVERRKTFAMAADAQSDEEIAITKRLTITKELAIKKLGAGDRHAYTLSGQTEKF